MKWKTRQIHHTKKIPNLGVNCWKGCLENTDKHLHCCISTPQNALNVTYGLSTLMEQAFNPTAIVSAAHSVEISLNASGVSRSPQVNGLRWNQTFQIKFILPVMIFSGSFFEASKCWWSVYAASDCELCGRACGLAVAFKARLILVFDKEALEHGTHLSADEAKLYRSKREFTWLPCNKLNGFCWVAASAWLNNASVLEVSCRNQGIGNELQMNKTSWISFQDREAAHVSEGSHRGKGHGTLRRTPHSEADVCHSCSGSKKEGLLSVCLYCIILPPCSVLSKFSDLEDKRRKRREEKEE